MANSKIVLSTGEILIDLTQDDIKPEHVQNGIKFHDKTGEQQSGTNKKTVDASEVTAEASEVLATKTFGKGDRVETGTMPNRGSVNGTISSKAGQYTIQQGYHDGGGKVGISAEEQAKLIPGNIKEGVVILGVTGEYGADDISSQSKEVTPTFEDQQVSPDAGYSFLSGVTVKGIPIKRQDNEAGGVTVIIG
jgi:hypothetical protein